MTEVAVLGGGLAGTTLAWQLHARGMRFRLYDRGESLHPHSASRVAAGLLTPVTGQRPALSWRFDELAPVAWAFYARVEALTGTTFFHPGPLVRLFHTPEERALMTERAATRFAGHVEVIDEPLDSAAFAMPHGGAVMRHAARLDVPAYLRASHAFFARHDAYEQAEVAITADIAATLGAKRVAFCQGYAANPLFPGVKFDASKGEILALRIPGLTEERTVNRHGQWLTRVGPGAYRAGSTYDRAALDDAPTPAGRARILDALSRSLRLPVEVTDHVAAVRPIIDDSRPLLAVHPDDPAWSYFNGLGSKGALTAPFFAATLADHLATGTAFLASGGA